MEKTESDRKMGPWARQEKVFKGPCIVHQGVWPSSNRQQSVMSAFGRKE